VYRVDQTDGETQSNLVAPTKTDPAPVTEKACSKCKVVKPLGEFHKNKTLKDGRKSTCKPCESLCSKDRYNYKVNEFGLIIERRSTKERQYVFGSNNIVLSASCCTCNEIKETSCFQRNSSNKYGLYSECRRCAAVRKKNAIDTQKTINAKLQWTKRAVGNPKHKEAGVTRFWLEREFECGCRNPFCRKKFDFTHAHCNQRPNAPSVDHKHPTSRQGPNVLSNVHLLCNMCNSAKSDLTWDEFLAIQAATGLTKRRKKPAPRKGHVDPAQLSLFEMMPEMGRAAL
jgi:HNH endonuclease